MTSFAKYKDHSLLLLRLAFGFRLIYGTQDNVFSWERMLEFSTFLEANGFPLPVVSAVISVALQFIAGICWVVGFRVRLAGLVMALNFTVALLMVHLSDSYLGAAPAIHLLIVSIFLMTAGGGRFGLDRD